jgi:hypothetical protein
MNARMTWALRLLLAGGAVAAADLPAECAAQQLVPAGEVPGEPRVLELMDALSLSGLEAWWAPTGWVDDWAPADTVSGTEWHATRGDGAPHRITLLPDGSVEHRQLESGASVRGGRWAQAGNKVFIRSGSVETPGIYATTTGAELFTSFAGGRLGWTLRNHAVSVRRLPSPSDCVKASRTAPRLHTARLRRGVFESVPGDQPHALLRIRPDTAELGDAGIACIDYHLLVDGEAIVVQSHTFDWDGPDLASESVYRLSPGTRDLHLQILFSWSHGGGDGVVHDVSDLLVGTIDVAAGGEYVLDLAYGFVYPAGSSDPAAVAAERRWGARLAADEPRVEEHLRSTEAIRLTRELVAALGLSGLEADWAPAEWGEGTAEAASVAGTTWTSTEGVRAPLRIRLLAGGSVERHEVGAEAPVTGGSWTQHGNKVFITYAAGDRTPRIYATTAGAVLHAEVNADRDILEHMLEGDAKWTFQRER